jgi:hypothetical protein
MKTLLYICLMYFSFFALNTTLNAQKPVRENNKKKAFSIIFRSISKTNRDYPLSPEDIPITTVPNPDLYTGSIASTSDDLYVYVGPSDAASPERYLIAGYTFIFDGLVKTVENPMDGATAVTFSLVQRNPGIKKLKCFARLTDGRRLELKPKTINLGVRTDHCMAIGWIDTNAIMLNSVGVNPYVLDAFKPNGDTRTGTLFILAALADGDAISIDSASTEYVLKWLFKYGGNPDPMAFVNVPYNSFVRDFPIGPTLVHSAVNSFLSDPTRYKMFNEFQIRYLVNNNGTMNITKTIYDRHLIGTTHSSFSSNPLVGDVAGQAGTFNGKTSMVYNQSAIMQINDGSPDARGVCGMNTLVNYWVIKSHPVSGWKYWEDIGSSIRFSTTNKWTPYVLTQDYPTYHIFINGNKIQTRVQLPTPSGHYLGNPFPFGPVDVTAEETTRIKGNYQGVVPSVPHPFARIPPAYVQNP